MNMMCNVIAFPARPAHPPLRRPKLLVRAARAGLSQWNRRRDLRRVLKSDDLPCSASALQRLRTEEMQLNAARCEGQADYDLHRHILLLIAILAETAELAARPLPAPKGPICS